MNTTTIETPGASLQGFSLDELAQFTREGKFAPDESPDHRLFFVGRDNVHGVLKYILSRVTRSLYLNMFGFDDDELGDLCLKAAGNPEVTALITLDKSQAGGVHEKKILSSMAARDPVAFNSHFAIGQSATHSISHTKGGILDGIVGFEGSTNWSADGEGTFVLGQNAAGGVGYRAQNNTLLVFTAPRTLSRFTDELIAEHLIAVHQGGALKAVS